MKEPNNHWHRSNKAKVIRRFSLAAAWLTGIFCLVACFFITTKHINPATDNLLECKSLQDLKQSSYKNQQDEQLKKEMLNLESFSRKAFFTNRSEIQAGGFLLLGGIIAFLITAKTAAEFRRRLPEPDGSPEKDDQIISGRTGRRAVIIFAIVLIIVSLVLAFRKPEIHFDVTPTENQKPETKSE